jgi:hypothetical protein
VIGFAPVMFFGRGIFQAGGGVYVEIQVCLKAADVDIQVHTYTVYINICPMPSPKRDRKL